MVKAGVAALSVLLSALTIFGNGKTDDAGLMFYLNSFCVIAFECIEAYTRVSNVNRLWGSPYVHYAIVAIVFCIGEVNLTLYWASIFLIMIKGSLKALKEELGGQYKELRSLSDAVNESAVISRAVAAMEILIVPWLFLMALVCGRGNWFIVWIVYFVVFLMFQLVHDDHHKWWYRQVSSKVREIANANGFGKEANEALKSMRGIETAARKLY